MTSQPIGLSNDLAPRQVMRAIIGQYDIAVWRSVSGVVNAWENRCPHRGMRLSHGFVRGESLACAYHGWHFNHEGFCHYIPAHPELTPPKTVQPGMYSVVEQEGLIWINPTDEASAVAIPPDCQPLRSLTFECDLETVTNTLSQTTFDNPGQHQPGTGINLLSDLPHVIALPACGHTNGIVIAFQISQNNRVVAHVLSSSDVSNIEKIRISRWLESARRRAEAAMENDA